MSKRIYVLLVIAVLLISIPVINNAFADHCQDGWNHVSVPFVGIICAPPEPPAPTIPIFNVTSPNVSYSAGEFIPLTMKADFNSSLSYFIKFNNTDTGKQLSATLWKLSNNPTEFKGFIKPVFPLSSEYIGNYTTLTKYDRFTTNNFKFEITNSTMPVYKDFSFTTNGINFKAGDKLVINPQSTLPISNQLLLIFNEAKEQTFYKIKLSDEGAENLIINLDDLRKKFPNDAEGKLDLWLVDNGNGMSAHKQITFGVNPPLPSIIELDKYDPIAMQVKKTFQLSGKIMKTYPNHGATFVYTNDVDPSSKYRTKVFVKDDGTFSKNIKFYEDDKAGNWTGYLQYRSAKDVPIKFTVEPVVYTIDERLTLLEIQMTNSTSQIDKIFSILAKIFQDPGGPPP